MSTGGLLERPVLYEAIAPRKEAETRLPSDRRNRADLIALLNELLADGRPAEASDVWTVLRQAEARRAERVAGHGVFSTLALGATTPAPIDQAPTGALDTWDF